MFNDIKEFLLSFWSKLRSKKLMKRFTGLIIICILTVLIPLSIAICYVQFVKGGQKIISPDISVSLFNADGRLIESETTQEDIIEASPFAGLFYKITTSKVKAQKPAEFTEKPNMSFTVTYDSQPSTFKCYFKEDPSQSYLEDERGGFYSPDHLAYSTFLTSPYSETVYEESAPPTLYTPLGDAITPNQAKWTYTLSDETEKLSENYEATEAILTYRIAGAINFSFSRKPDICTVTVKSLNGSTVFFGSPEKLASLTVEENSELLVSVSAIWEDDGKVTSYGKQQYEFKIICVEPSTFSISATEAVGGQVLVLSVSDVDDVDSIIYAPTSDFDDEASENDSASKALDELYSYRPIFVKEGSNAYALLPIPANIPDTVFAFSISCGISRSDITLKLNKATAKNGSSPDAVLTNAQKAEFLRILFNLKRSTDDVLLLHGDFALPDTYGFTQAQAYNTTVNGSFTLLGSCYRANGTNGMTVQSANVGIVSEVGYSPLLGNYVIIDHGMGLLSWYCGLSDVSVGEKNIVKKGDPIGRAGSSSLLCENGVNIICSVGGVLVDPDELYNKKTA